MEQPSALPHSLNRSVSVIIPVYNGKAFVGDAIDSVLKQQGDYVHEIVVVDDGSSDGTADFITVHYPDTVRLIAKPENAGASAARNTGIFAAKGAYVAFLDADDVWRADKLERQMPIFSEYQAGMVCSSGKIIELAHHASNPHTGYGTAGKTEPLSQAYVFEHPLIYTTSIVLSTQLARELNGFDTHYHTAEDIDFVLRLTTCATIYLCAEPLVEYRRRENSLGSSPDSYRDHLAVLDAFLANNPSFAQQHHNVIKRTRRTIYDKWLENELYQRNFTQFYRTLRTAIRLSFSPTACKLMLKSVPLLCLSVLKHKSHP